MNTFWLECSACGSEATTDRGVSVCEECGKPIFARYAPAASPNGRALAGRWRARGPGMWRFSELLPLHAGEQPVTLGEGSTPLLPLPVLGDELGGLLLYVKDEGRSPTGSFKDRGLSAAVTRAVRDGAQALVVPSAGNAGAALAAYGARAGVPTRVYIPADTPAGVVYRCNEFGAEVITVEGLITDCGIQAAAYARETGAKDVSTLREPYRVEGKKTMMLEIVEALDGRAPDAIVYPTGGGTGLIASWKVLAELEAHGIADRHTRMYAVQSRGCSPIIRAWEQGRPEATAWPEAETEAWGLRVPHALGDFLILRAIRESGGGAVAVDDADMIEGARELAAREGINAAIEGGATLAATRELVRKGLLHEGETVVLFNTGHMLNY